MLQCEGGMIRQGFDIERGLRNAVFFQRAGKQKAEATYEFVSRELPSARSERCIFEAHTLEAQ